MERIRAPQDEETWIAHLKQVLRGNVEQLDDRALAKCRRIAEFELDVDETLWYVGFARPPPTTEEVPDRDSDERDPRLRLVLPMSIHDHDDVLHHYHASLEGGHQGIGRTYARVRKFFYWRGMFASVQRFIGSCVDCETGKGKRASSDTRNFPRKHRPHAPIPSGHIPSLPASDSGKTELLTFVDAHSGFIIAKATASRTAQTIAEAYDEAVFRRFGASEVLRHDREPGFMSDFFKAFSRILGQQQRATLAYRPQANGLAERKVQTITRAMKLFIADAEQRDWDEYAERLVFALNTS